jgi:hypothetical protein
MTQNSTGQAVLATTAGEKIIGVLQDDPDTANEAGLIMVQGVTKVIAGDTFAHDALLTTNALGKVIAVADQNDYVMGRALSSAVVNDIVPVMMPAGTNRGFSAGTISIPMSVWQEQDGTALADFVGASAALPGYSAGDESFGIRWNNHANPDPISCSISTPADFDNSQDVTMNILAAKTGATSGDAVTWLVEAFNNVDAALYDADADYGGTSSAMTGADTAKTAQLETLTLAAADLPAANSVIVLTLQPTDGTLGTDDVIVLGVWLNYTRK